MNVIEYPDSELLALHLADLLASELRVALEHKERVLFVVPGGTTPGPVFDSLCAADLDWSRVTVLLSDERWLPEVHVRSNTRLVRERLLIGRAQEARLLPLYLKDRSAEEAIPVLEAVIDPELPIDVCLLGMGNDMHTASLFPGADGLDAALDPHASVLVAVHADGVPEARITLTARVLRSALSLHIAITGAAKRTALERARGLSPSQAPVSAILDQAQVHWAE